MVREYKESMFKYLVRRLAHMYSVGTLLWDEGSLPQINQCPLMLKRGLVETLNIPRCPVQGR